MPDADLKFLSTLPARGATLAVPWEATNKPLFLSTLPARGATPTYADMASAIKFLSTLPARGATGYRTVSYNASIKFLSTLPARGATPGLNLLFHPFGISIHAPREGSDCWDTCSHSRQT